MRREAKGKGASLSTTMRDFLYGGVYLVACRFANIDRFIERISAELDLEAAADAKSAAAMILDLADGISPDGLIQDDESALRKLMADDLRAIAGVQIPDAELSCARTCGQCR